MVTHMLDPVKMFDGGAVVWCRRCDEYARVTMHVGGATPRTARAALILRELSIDRLLVEFNRWPRCGIADRDEIWHRLFTLAPSDAEVAA